MLCQPLQILCVEATCNQEKTPFLWISPTILEFLKEKDLTSSKAHGFDLWFLTSLEGVASDWLWHPQLEQRLSTPTLSCHYRKLYIIKACTKAKRSHILKSLSLEGVPATDFSISSSNRDQVPQQLRATTTENNIIKACGSSQNCMHHVCFYSLDSNKNQLHNNTTKNIMITITMRIPIGGSSSTSSK